MLKLNLLKLNLFKLSFNQQIALGAVLGVAFGAILSMLDKTSSLQTSSLYLLSLLGNLFVDLLKMVMIPLVFTTIVVGIANLQAHQQIHRVWTTTLIFFIFSMALAMLLSMSLMNFFEPGQGLHLSLFQSAMENFKRTPVTPSEFVQQIFHSLFQNPFSAFAKGEVLAVIVFAIFIGVALVMGGSKFKNLLAVFQEFLDLMMLILNGVMKIAPIGIFALLAKLVATQDIVLLATLGKFIAIIIAATLIHGFILLPLVLWLVTKKSPLWFLRGARPAMITAFATASSNATLPITLRSVQENLNVEKNIASFVVPLGATINMDGTALYEAAAALFIANLAGIDLSFTQQMIVFITAMIAGMGAPGIPSAGMVTMVMVLQSVGLPVEAIAILLPIDRLLDAFRTMVNVEGDMVGSVIVQKIVNGKS